MTYKEKLMQEHPEWGAGVIDEKITYNCPRDFYPGAESPLDCSCGCETCWDQEIPETEPAANKEACKTENKGVVQDMLDISEACVQARASLVTGGFTNEEAFDLINNLIIYKYWKENNNE